MADTPSREVPTQEYVLRAMVANYTAGCVWDHLDFEVCTKAADEIKSLRARLAAKPSDEGVRDAAIEECAKILDACAQDWNRIRDPGMANNARAYARKIRALSPGEPKP